MGTSGFTKLLIGLLVIANAAAWFFIFSPVALFEYRFPEGYGPQQYLDALDMAVSLGRLDAISMLLTVLGIFLAVAALFGFSYIRSRTEEVSRQTTEDLIRSLLDEAESDIMEESEPRLTFLPTSDVDKEGGTDDD